MSDSVHSRPLVKIHEQRQQPPGRGGVARPGGLDSRTAITIAGLAFALWILAAVTGESSWTGLASAGLASLGSLVGAGLIRMSRPVGARWLILGSVWGGGVVFLIGAGTASPGTTILLVSVVLGGLLSGTRAVAGLAVASVVASLLVWLLLPDGIDPTAQQVMAQRRFFIELEVFAAVSALAVWWAVRLEQSAADRTLLADAERARDALQQAVDGALSGVAIADGTGRLTWVNRTALHMWGLSEAAEAYQRPASQFWADPEEAAGVARRLLRDRSLVAELRARRLDGTEFDVEISGSLSVDADGQSPLLVASMVDISGRKDAERQAAEARERTRAIVDNANDIVLILDREGRIVFENAAVERVLGFATGERLGDNIMAHAHPDDVPAAEEGFAVALAGPDRVARVTLRFRHKAGGWRWLETVGRDLSHEPAIGGILGIGRDVTEQRALQSRLQITERLETVGRLAGGLAHDFNNLLTAIVGNVELASGAGSPGEIRRQLDRISEAAQRASDLAKKLLGFARLDQTRPVVLDLRRQLLAGRDLLQRLLGDVVMLRLDVGDLPLTVLIDPVQFEQIMLNLTINARDAMPDGGSLTIVADEVSVDTLDPSFLGNPLSGHAVRIRAVDTGQGMAPDVQARVFEPFFTTKEYGRGTGLGLSTVYGVVLQAGGAIRVASDIGAGATFEILLPAVAGEEYPALPAEPASARAAVILLAEDDSAVRHLMQDSLTAAGYRVITARNGAQGMLLANQHADEIDLLVTDVVMPDATGPELARHFRRLRPDRRVIFVTGYMPDPSLTEEAAAMGAVVMHKPFRMVDLVARVAAQLRVGPA